MALIPTEIVSTTWREVAESNEDVAAIIGQQFADEQPHLVEFVFGAGAMLSDDAAELGVYLATVVWSMFERSHGRVPQVKGDFIARSFAVNQALLDGVEFEDVDELLHHIALHGDLRQPPIIRYLAESLVEVDEDDSEFDAELSELGELFVVLKSVVDCLDGALGRYPLAEA